MVSEEGQRLSSVLQFEKERVWLEGAIREA